MPHAALSLALSRIRCGGRSLGKRSTRYLRVPILLARSPSASWAVSPLSTVPSFTGASITRYTKVAIAELDVRFSVTTNGTLLRAEDLALLRTHRFAVTISIDGGAAQQDRQRPALGRTKSSFAALKHATSPLLADPGQAQIAARATVTRGQLDLSQYFDDILALGFPEVGFSPLRVDRNGRALRDEDWPRYLDALERVARAELARGGPIRLTNLAVALKQIARGASSPYPCGAGGGYFSVSSAGQWYACHRAIGVDEFAMGDNAGLDEARRLAFLKARHVHAQAACRRCWARYLCSGACHQEASARSDLACGFVRGWLEFCLSIYCELAPHPTGARIFSARELWS